jgi:hypothetical protein
MMTENEPPVCGICHFEEHAHTGMRHAFSVEGILTSVDDQAKNRIPRPPSSSDHVLRLALIEAGTLTADQITEAAKKFTAL